MFEIVLYVAVSFYCIFIHGVQTTSFEPPTLEWAKQDLWGTGAESKFIVASFPFAKIIVLFEGSFWQKDSLPQYSRVRKKHTGTIINFSGFWLCIKVSNLCYLRGDYVYSRGYVYCFRQMFQGLCLFKGVRLFRTLE